MQTILAQQENDEHADRVGQKDYKRINEDCLMYIKTIGQSLGSILIFGVHILKTYSFKSYQKQTEFFLKVGVQ